MKNNKVPNKDGITIRMLKHWYKAVKWVLI